MLFLPDNPKHVICHSVLATNGVARIIKIRRGAARDLTAASAQPAQGSSAEMRRRNAICPLLINSFNTIYVKQKLFTYFYSWGQRLLHVGYWLRRGVLYTNSQLFNTGARDRQEDRQTSKQTNWQRRQTYKHINI